MARRTATDFVNEVRDALGGETSETISDTRILRWVNEEYKTLCAKHLFPQLRTSETVTTTSGTATYELSEADIIAVEDVVDTTNGLYLREMNDYQYGVYTQGNASSTTGNPYLWYVDGVGSNNRFNIKLFPTPDGTYSLTVSYYEFTELVTSPSATSAIIPIQFDNVILNRAVAQGMRALGNHDSAYRWLLGANEMEQAAKGTIHITSYIPIKPRSIISRDLE